MPKSASTNRPTARKITQKKKTTKLPSKWQHLLSYRTALVAVFVVLLAAVGAHYHFGLGAQSYPFVPSGVADRDAWRVNNWRSNHGFATYTRKACLNTVAAKWARQEAVNHAIADPSLSYMKNTVSTYCTSKWIGIGANDGVGQYQPSDTYGGEYPIWQALLNSCPHVMNIASRHAVKTTGGLQCSSTMSTFKYYGTAAYVGSDNRLYISQWFAAW